MAHRRQYRRAKYRYQKINFLRKWNQLIRPSNELLTNFRVTYNYLNSERQNGYQRLNAAAVETCSAKPQLCRAKKDHTHRIRLLEVVKCDIVKGCEINLKKTLNMLLRLSAEYDRA